MINKSIIMVQVVFFCYLALLGCKDERRIESDTARVFQKFPVTEQIKFEKFLKYDQQYGRSLFLTDTSLIVTNNKNLLSDYFFYEYSLKTKKLTGKYIKGGSKKGMVLAPLSCGLFHKNKLWLQDISLNKVVVASLDNKFSFDSLSLEEYTTPELSYSVQLLDSGQLLKSGIYHVPQLLQVTDLKTNLPKRAFGELSPAPDNTPVNSWKKANEGFLYVKPTEDKAVLACRYADKIEVFDIKTGTSKIVKGPENFDPAFLPIKTGTEYAMQRTEKTIYAFTNGAVTEKYIYLLYSGNNQNSDYRIEGTTIYVYDWNGNPVKKIKLDRYITGFAISENDSDIYAFDPGSSFILHSTLKN